MNAAASSGLLVLDGSQTRVRTGGQLVRITELAGQGPAGPQGPQGPQGPAGAPGAQAPLSAERGADLGPETAWRALETHRGAREYTQPGSRRLRAGAGARPAG